MILKLSRSKFQKAFLHLWQTMLKCGAFCRVIPNQCKQEPFEKALSVVCRRRSFQLRLFSTIFAVYDNTTLVWSFLTILKAEVLLGISKPKKQKNNTGSKSSPVFWLIGFKIKCQWRLRTCTKCADMSCNAALFWVISLQVPYRVSTT